MQRCLSLIFGLLVFCGCRDRELQEGRFVQKGSFIAYRDDMGDTRDVVVNCGGKTASIKSEEFRFVFDWSDTYNREDYGTAWFINGRELVFGGCLNHSRSMYYLYDCQTEQIDIIANVVEFGMDEKLGWYFLLGPPLYAQDAIGSKYDLYVNGDLATSFKTNTLYPDIEVRFDNDGALLCSVSSEHGEVCFDLVISVSCIPHPPPRLSQTKNITFYKNQ